MSNKLLTSFKAASAQLLGAADTIASVLFGSASTGPFGVFSMTAAGAMTMLASTGRVTVKTKLNLGGAVTATATFLVRYTLNGTQVGDTLTVLVPVGSTVPVMLEHEFDSLSKDDVLLVQLVIDAASSATDGGTVLTAGTSNASTWTSAYPAVMEIHG